MTDDPHAHDHADHDGEHEHEHHHHHLDYASQVEAFRASKDEYFRTAPASPIPLEEREGFDGLAYFPVDPGLRFEGLSLEPYRGSEPEAFEMLTSDGRLRPAHRVGSLRFELEGRPQALAGYTLDGGRPGSLFVPFADATSGQETYGAGRYLDLEPEDDGTYALDFNLAYHPFCVYAPAYSCPLPPPENRLGVRIEAGERLPAPTATDPSPA